MNKNRKIMIYTGAFLLVALLITGYVALASGGTQSDPLVTLSYINDVLKPQTEQEAKVLTDKLASEYEKELQTEMLKFSEELDDEIAQFEAKLTALMNDSEFMAKLADEIEKNGGDTIIAPSTWRVVSVPSGKVLSGSVGTEILLRIGEANCYTDGSVGIINLSSGTELTNGKALSQNNLYIVTVDGRGLRAMTDVTVLVSGDYQIK